MGRIAAHVMEVAQDDLDFCRRRVCRGLRLALTLREIATMAHSRPDRSLPKAESFGLEATDFYDPPVATITNATHSHRSRSIL